jgi:MEMO1 family protein
MPHRKAEKAGSWYPSAEGELRQLVNECLQRGEAPGPGGVPVAAIVPHAGLSFSGPTAGLAYRHFQGGPAEAVETVVVLGAVHTMHLEEPVAWPDGAWETPLGALEIDEELAQALRTDGLAGADPRPHLGDNAIELQTPFVRHVFPEARFCAVAVPPVEGVEAFGAGLLKTAERLGRRIAVFGSTDLTHYGASFGLMPAGSGPEAVEWTRANDRRLIDHMLALETKKIVPAARRDHSACGAGAAAATVAYAQASGAQAQLLEQTTSYDIMPDGEANHLVGYASILFRLAGADGGAA